MPEIAAQKSYSPPECKCRKLPHKPGCPVAPFFSDEEKLELESAEGDYHDTPQFIIECPRGCRFLQFEHAVDYDYSPVQGSTEQTEIPLVCPKCGYSDKQFLPAIVGFDPAEDEDDKPFKIICPNSVCQAEYDRTDGVVDIWLTREVLMGIEQAKVRGLWRKKGQVVTEYTELSIECTECGHQCGETED